MTKWTDAQRDALVSDGNLLVSASAGSGKTTVMLERVLDYLTASNNSDIKKLVVITFTNAAAEEMKEKLLEKLYDKIRLREDNYRHLQKQVLDFQFANISTIDSYCAELYKHYFEVLGLDSSLAVMEESDATALYTEARDAVFEEYLTNGDEAFVALANSFSSKRDIDKLRSAVTAIHKFLAVQADRDDFIRKVTEDCQKPLDDMTAIDALLKSIRKKAAYLTERCENYQVLAAQSEGVLGSKLTEALINVLDVCRDMVSQTAHCDSLKKFYGLSAGFAPFRMPSQKPQEEAGAKIKEDVKRLLAQCRQFIKERVTEIFADGYETACIRDVQTKVNVAKLLETVQKAELVYDEEKRKKGRMDFADLERFALKILSNDAVAAEVRENTDYVFMDEYQDTNYLQESILAKIDKNNVFMVGDVKQSIYRFRYAEPHIFLDKSKRYEDTEDGKNIRLNDNFRSCKQVLDFVNLVFDEIMTYDFGGIDYRKDARLIAGASYPEANDVPHVEAALFEKRQSENEDELPPVYSVANGAKKQIKKPDEAVYIADKIEELVGKKAIYDAKLGVMRPCKYSDVAVLSRVKKAAEVEEIFKARAIPYTADGFRNGNGMQDINLLLNYIRVIDNLRQDLPLAAVLNSYFGKLSDEEMLKVRQNSPKAYFWEAVTAYSGDISIQNKIESIVNSIKKYKLLSRFVSVKTLLETILAESGYDAYLMAQSDGSRIQRVNAFIFSLEGKDGNESVKSFLKYCKTDDALQISFVPTEDNAVTLMSIHKSKGLEFPIVFLTNVGSVPKAPADSGMVLLDNKLGLSIKYADENSDKKCDTPVTRAFLDKARTDEREELVRLLYVAMTRARYHLFICGEKGKGDYASAEEANSFAGLIQYALSKNDLLSKYFVTPNLTDEPDIAKEETLFVPTSREHYEPYRDYRGESARELCAKYSVSELNADTDDGLPLVAYVAQDEDEAVRGVSAELGVAYHKALELIDFAAPTKEAVEENILKAVASGLMEPLPCGFDFEVIWQALQNPLIKRLSLEKCLKEQPFMLYVPASEIADTDSKERVLVQGVIDLLALGEKTILVDYKTSALPVSAVCAKYKKQLELYAAAVKKCLGKDVDEKYLFIINRNRVYPM